MMLVVVVSVWCPEWCCVLSKQQNHRRRTTSKAFSVRCQSRPRQHMYTTRLVVLTHAPPPPWSAAGEARLVLSWIWGGWRRKVEKAKNKYSTKAWNGRRHQIKLVIKMHFWEHYSIELPNVLFYNWISFILWQRSDIVFVTRLNNSLYNFTYYVYSSVLNSEAIKRLGLQNENESQPFLQSLEMTHYLWNSNFE